MFRNFLILVFLSATSVAQTTSISGIITENGQAVPFVNLILKNTEKGTSSDENGFYSLKNLAPGEYILMATALGYEPYHTTLSLSENQNLAHNFELNAAAQALDEMVVTGTLKAVNRMESAVPVEVYSPTFLKQNPTPNVFKALQNINGVRPQINCNVCNTGDIHINGLEGPYTLVLIDGMPIVSGLGTVYGLSGIPNSLINQIEIVKGPASTLYGSEAVGGLINVITKNAIEAPLIFMDSYASSWGEFNFDTGAKFSWGSKTDAFVGVNYFKYNQPIDNNGDNFTDLTLQDRISIFQKWNFKRKNANVFSVAGRFFYEDRWGGEMQWTPEYRGGNEIYGESIYTRRWEIIGKYQLPLKEKILLSISYNIHHQNSVYGNTAYMADQRIGFGQLTWDKTLKKHDLLLGAALRYNYYDDNTPATANFEGNFEDEVIIPSLFVQDEYKFNEKHSLLGGIRYDYDLRHGNIFTPRGAYRYKITDNDILRLNFGTGFRVVNLFTEDHAALTGAREVLITEALEPERSMNFNLNYLKKIYADNGTFLGFDVSAFYTKFSNQILPDYDTNAQQIIYDNLVGKAVSKGISMNLDLAFTSGLKFMLGATFQEVTNTENGVKKQQILTERFTGTWNVSYTIHRLNLRFDYTGNLYGPMRLPLLSELDPRSEYSPTWSIQNLQFTYKGLQNFEFYAGVKNLLDWTPNRGNPFIIARAHDPFDRNVQHDQNGAVLSTANNPYALTFDPSYVYGPNQGIRGFFGLRFTVL